MGWEARLHMPQIPAWLHARVLNSANLFVGRYAFTQRVEVSFEDASELCQPPSPPSPPSPPFLLLAAAT